MDSRDTQDRGESISQYAYMLRVIYPDLYEYLVRRDQLLHRILLRFPDLADPEAGAARIDLAGLVKELKALPPGVSDLGREQHTDSEQR